MVRGEGFLQLSVATVKFSAVLTGYSKVGFGVIMLLGDWENLYIENLPDLPPVLPWSGTSLWTVS